MSQHTDYTKAHMDKAIDALKTNFSRVRSGRANANILDPIKVDYYGVPTPITQLAGVKVPEASMLVIERDVLGSLGEVLLEQVFVVAQARSP